MITWRSAKHESEMQMNEDRQDAAARLTEDRQDAVARLTEDRQEAVARLTALAAPERDLLLVCLVPVLPDPALAAALLKAAALPETPQAGRALAARLPDLLAETASLPGAMPRAVKRAALLPVARVLDSARWSLLHQCAAAHCVDMSSAGRGDAAAWEVQEVYHLWEAGSPQRHQRLDQLVRLRLRTRDDPGCRALITAAEEAGGGDDPLLRVCEGMYASEFTREWGEAETLFQQALQHPDLLSGFRAKVLSELGLLHFFQGRFADAVPFFSEAAVLAEQGDDMFTLADVLMNLGIAYTEGAAQQQLPRSVLIDALNCQQRVLSILQPLRDEGRLLRAWSNLGSVYYKMARYDQALHAYRRALELLPTDQPFIKAALLNNIAEVDMLRGALAEAQAEYEDVLAIWRETGGDLEMAEALVNMGSVQERRGLTEEAIAGYRQAIAAVESLRSRLKAEESRAGFLATRLAPYERLAALYCALPGHEAEAFEVVERAKARAFIELLAERPVRPPREVPASLLEREQKVRAALAHLYRMGAHAGAAGPAAVRAAALEAELEDVYRQMRRLDAQYAGVRTVDTLTLDDVRARLPEAHALLEYFSVGDELGCFVITAGAVHVQLLPGLASYVEEVLTPTSDSAVPPNATAAGDTVRASRLYELALAPIAALLSASTNVTIVPHGLLHYLPLHALGAPAPLLAEHRISYAPSASVLLRDHPEAPDSPRGTCLSLGYDGGDLRFADLEALHVAALTGGDSLLGAEATAAALLQHGGAYRSLHVVCHGEFNAQAPLASGLLLADGKLDAMTVMQQLRLHADLVVLSACDTGQARVLRGDELMGLARAFLYAGADQVLVTLWPVDDFATALLMDAFYRERAQLPAGREGIAEALRRAQQAVRSQTAQHALAAAARLRRSASGSTDLEVWVEAAPAPESATESNDHPYTHPYYWAGFVLICG